jgi:hypothetical protein
VYFNDTKDIEDPLVFNLTKFKRQAISAGQLTQSPNKTISFPK